MASAGESLPHTTTGDDAEAREERWRRTTKAEMLNARELSAARHTLKHVTTVERGHPVIFEHSWEKAAVEGPAHDDDKASPDDSDATAATAAGAGAARVVAAAAAAAPTICDDADSADEVHGWAYVAHVKGKKRGILSRSAAVERWAAAPRVVDCEADARPGYATKKAHEYHETPATLRAKVKALADLVRRSKNCVAYTGAGISTASGIGDYASRTRASLGAGASRPKLRTPFEAQPTLAHHVLTAMYRSGSMVRWIQQNHDGLPQKAGMPQVGLNEIHGAWYDVSNPVIPMSGSLRTDLFEDVLDWEQRADLVLALGSSLCGMNVDRVPVTCAEKALTGEALGTVIVSLQRTQYDASATLRIYATIDAVAELLAEELALTEMVAASQRVAPYSLPPTIDKAEGEELFEVPYCAVTGKASAGTRTTLDLRDGAKVRLTGGMYEGDEGVVQGRNLEGHWRVQLFHATNPKRPTKKVPFVRVLGSWWIEAAVKGEVPIIPVVNVPEALPVGWSEHKSGKEHGGVYYYTHEDGRSQWDRPGAAADAGASSGAGALA